MLSDPDRRFDVEARPPAKPATPPLKSRESDESIRTEFCDGPVLDDVSAPFSHSLTFPDAPEEEEEEEEEQQQQRPVSSSRQDLIERIKRGESPTWAPKSKVYLYFYVLMISPPLCDYGA